MSKWGKEKETMKKKIIITLILFSFINLCFLTSSSMYEQRSENINVIFVIDNSGSMASNDPYKLRFTATKLFISLLDPGDTVGMVVFSKEAYALNEGIVTINAMEDKAAITDTIPALIPDGYTDVKAAFSLVSDLVHADSTQSNQSVIVFLTDGQPEPAEYYASYEQDTIDLITSLNMPVISVALTNGASMQFLTKISSQTDGQLYSARTHLDLIDVYLDILGQWKDRTVVGEGVITGPTSETVSFDPGLNPYLSEISFVVTKNERLDVSLINPEGKVVKPGNPSVSFYQDEDPDFTVITINEEFIGEWQVELAGEGQAQLRVIISSRLKADLLSDNNFAEAGQPLLIEAQILEFDDDGTSHRVIGDGRFSAVVTSPDGSQESIDQLFDDGTHGDAVVDDGLFSRIYQNTSVPGTYSIELNGNKGLIPLSAKEMITLLAVPAIEIEAPQAEEITLNAGEAIDVAVRIGEPEESLDSGTVRGKTTDENGNVALIDLMKNGNVYSGHFEPSKSGHYILEAYVEEGVFQTLPYAHTSETELDVYIIPNLSINLVGERSDILVENWELNEGISFQVEISSTADEAVSLEPSIEGPLGIYLAGPEQITIAPKETIERRIWVQSDSNLDLRQYDFQMVFATLEKANIQNASIPITMTLFEPTVTVENYQPIICDDPIGCWNWKSDMSLEINSSSREPVKLQLTLVDEGSLRLSTDEITVEPGQGEYEIELTNTSFFSSGQHEFELLLEPARDSAVMEEGSDRLLVQMDVPSFVSRCKKNIIWAALIFFGSVMITSRVLRAITLKRKSSIVTGTLRIWTDGHPDIVRTVDLTALGKLQLQAGSDPRCDILLESGSIKPIHFTLESRKNAGEYEIVLIPVGEVKQKYSYIDKEWKLDNESKFTVKDTHFQYLSDSGY
jgi:hypothetical protein